MNLYLQAWKKYAVFNGRARRKEYCYLFYMLIYIVLAIIDGVAGTFSEEAGVGAAEWDLWASGSATEHRC
jgi:uncharacterized membrane protein YhaH (DUF805 family)